MDSLDMAGHLIRRLHQQATLVFVQRTQAAGFDLTPVQFAALDAIHHQPGADQALAQAVAHVLRLQAPLSGPARVVGGRLIAGGGLVSRRGTAGHDDQDDQPAQA